jgi:hypothetical protein
MERVYNLSCRRRECVHFQKHKDYNTSFGRVTGTVLEMGKELQEVTTQQDIGCKTTFSEAVAQFFCLLWSYSWTMEQIQILLHFSDERCMRPPRLLT